MEEPLRLESTLTKLLYKSVAILIIMEEPLRHEKDIFLARQQLCRNPYYNGRASKTLDN